MGVPDGGVVGSVYGLRTFSSTDFGSVVVSDTDTNWTDWPRPAQAQCSVEMRGLIHDGVPAPHDDCTCGIYSFNNVRDLFRGYLSFAINIVAVVSLEGNVIVHDRGYRSEKATIVAFWSSDGGNSITAAMEAAAERTYAEDGVTVYVNGDHTFRKYSSLKNMVDDYGIPVDISSPTLKEKVLGNKSVRHIPFYLLVGIVFSYLISLTRLDMAYVAIGVVVFEWVLLYRNRKSLRKKDTSKSEKFLSKHIHDIVNGSIVTYFCMMYFDGGIPRLVSNLLVIAVAAIVLITVTSILSRRETRVVERVVDDALKIFLY